MKAKLKKKNFKIKIFKPGFLPSMTSCDVPCEWGSCLKQGLLKKTLLGMHLGLMSVFPLSKWTQRSIPRNTLMHPRNCKYNSKCTIYLVTLNIFLGIPIINFLFPFLNPDKICMTSLNVHVFIIIEKSIFITEHKDVRIFRTHSIKTTPHPN